jgi:membrane-bound ClpP family serine protease
MLHYGWRMSDRPALSRPVAITLVVLTGLAFVGILAGLAVGRIDIAGISGVVLVVLWFAVLGFRGRR